MNRVFHILWICLFTCSFKSTLWAQTEAESGGGSIELQSQTDQGSVMIPVKSKIGVQYTLGQARHNHETLDAVRDTSVVISGTQLGVQYLDKITMRNDSRYKIGKKIFWVSLGIFLAFVLVVGIAAIVALASFYGFGGSISLLIALEIVATILGIGAAVSMPGGLIAGIVVMAVASKTYRLKQDWKVVTHPSTND